MIKQIITELKNNNITSYLINKEATSTTELYFIKKQLDMRRLSEVTKYEVTIYKDFEKNGTKMRGFSSCILNPGMSTSDISNKLKETLYAASFACNPFFEFPNALKEDEINENNSFSLNDTIKNTINALYKNDTDSNCFINSSEIFVETKEHLTLSSWGTNVSYKTHCVHGEFVVQCTTPEDVETYQDFYYKELDEKALSEKVKRTLILTRERSKAQKCNLSGSIKVILSGQYVSDILHFYSDRAAASMIYPKYSDFEIGKQVQAQNIKADKLNINLISELPYSIEGIPLNTIPLLENGNLKSIHGATRFCRYLNVEPVGLYSGIDVKPGTTTLEEMETGKYLHIVNFSDFQMDSMSGRFGGEFRLAFYCDGSQIIPITNGSISGSILELADEIKLSIETQTLKDYTGPYAVEIQNVSIG